MEVQKWKCYTHCRGWCGATNPFVFFNCSYVVSVCIYINYCDTVIALKEFVPNEVYRNVQASRRTMKVKDLIAATNVSNNKVNISTFYMQFTVTPIHCMNNRIKILNLKTCSFLCVSLQLNIIREFYWIDYSCN